MKELINSKYGSDIKGALLLKQDSHLAIAGSVKARGGIYEVLKHTEDLALEHGLLTKEDSYEKLATDEVREFFKRYTIQVGSTGNLGYAVAAKRLLKHFNEAGVVVDESHTQYHARCLCRFNKKAMNVVFKYLF